MEHNYSFMVTSMFGYRWIHPTVLLLIHATHCQLLIQPYTVGLHGDVIKWKHFPRYWPFARGIHRSPVNSSNKSQWRGALMYSLICAWINAWVNNREAGDLRRYRAHYDVTVMYKVTNKSWRGPTDCAIHDRCEPCLLGSHPKSHIITSPCQSIFLSISIFFAQN